MPQVKLPFVERINPQSKYSAINGVEKEVTGDSKINRDSPEKYGFWQKLSFFS